MEIAFSQDAEIHVIIRIRFGSLYFGFVFLYPEKDDFMDNLVRITSPAIRQLAHGCQDEP
jgi:hypothetical protein